MEKPFDFSSLPKEIVDVLNDVIHWRLAVDSGLKGIAKRRAINLDKSSEVFRDWCSRQGELKEQERQQDQGEVAPRRAGRKERQKRIAQQSALKLVEGAE